MKQTMKKMMTGCALAALTTIGAAASELDAIGWRIDRDVDAFDDSTILTAILNSDSIREDFSKIGSHAPGVVIVRCVKGETDVYVGSHGYLGTDPMAVRYRFDGEKAITETWTGATGGKAMFLPDGYKDFRNGLRTAGRVVIELEDFHGMKDQASFSHLAENRDQMLEVLACEE